MLKGCFHDNSQIYNIFWHLLDKLYQMWGTFFSSYRMIHDSAGKIAQHDASKVGKISCTLQFVRKKWPRANE